MAHVLASVAEREAIGQRTRDAVAAYEAAGVRLGREGMTHPAVVARIVAARSADQTPAAMRALDRRRRADAQWWAALVAKHLQRVVTAERRREAA